MLFLITKKKGVKPAKGKLTMTYHPEYDTPEKAMAQFHKEYPMGFSYDYNSNTVTHKPTGKKMLQIEILPHKEAKD